MKSDSPQSAECSREEEIQVHIIWNIHANILSYIAVQKISVKQSSFEIIKGNICKINILLFAFKYCIESFW